MADLGKVTVTVEAEAYQTSKVYEIATIVSHDGSTWMSMKTVPAGQAPTDSSTYWKMLASNKASRIEQDATHRFVTDVEKSTWNDKADKTTATTSAAGLMSAAMVTKLNGVEIGAQKNIGVPVYISETAPEDTSGVWVVKPTA